MTKLSDWMVLTSEVISLPQLEAEEIRTEINRNIHEMGLLRGSLSQWTFDLRDEAENLRAFRAAQAEYHFLAWVVRTRLLSDPEESEKDLLLPSMERHRNASGKLLRKFGTWYGEALKRSSE